MAKCASCGKTIIFGGVKEGGRRFCNDTCSQSALAEVARAQLSDEEILHHVQVAHAGPCPKCNGPGPVDVHFSHSALSVIILTQWESVPAVSCRACARRKQSFCLVITTLLGWWGIPFGLFVTPMQIYRNIAALTAGDRGEPSPALVEWVSEDLGRRRLSSGG